MADTMQFDLVSPERSVVSTQARSVRIPGAEGDLSAMPGHTPTITTLRPGLLLVEDESGSTEEYLVTGGFAEIGPSGTTVLAEASMHRSEVTQDWYQGALQEARRAHSEAQPDAVDSAAKLVEDMVAVGGHIGLATDSRAPAP